MGIATMIELLWLPALAALILCVASGPLGCFMVWRRTAYFGDTIAHASLVGVALGLVLELNLTLSVLLCCVFVAALLIAWQGRSHLASDTLLGIIAHGSLALGLLLVSALAYKRTNLFAFLMGDLLTVTSFDVAVIAFFSITATALLLFNWRPLLLGSIDQDLAAAEGLNPRKLDFILALATAALIAISVKIVGVLLITAMLIIPAATARNFSRSPEAMAILASSIGATALIIALVLSAFLDFPIGPAFVVVSLVIFSASLVRKN